MEKFKYTLDNKRYHTFNYFLRNKYHSKVFKIPIDIGSTCPNKKSGGCIFCKDNSKANIINNSLSLMNQYLEIKNNLAKKWPNAKNIIYFQTGSNTNIPVNLLKEYCELFIKLENVVGVSIATRPDCISDKCYKYLSILNKKTFLTIELGLQSSNENTLRYLNRGHKLSDFTNTVMKLHQLNIFTVAHIINGIYNETKDDMLNTIKYLNNIHIDGVKIHMLNILKDTTLGDNYQKNPYKLLTREEYIDIVISQLELLNPNIVIERIISDPIKEDLIAPLWHNDKKAFLNDIDKEMKKRNTYQGKKIISK